MAISNRVQKQNLQSSIAIGVDGVNVNMFAEIQKNFQNGGFPLRGGPVNRARAPFISDVNVGVIDQQHFHYLKYRENRLSTCYRYHCDFFRWITVISIT
ncbi:unnamed protein product, partial [Nesidiocoris tenuis]